MDMDKKYDLPREMVQLFLGKIAVSLATGNHPQTHVSVSECEQLCEQKMRDVREAADACEQNPTFENYERGAAALYDALSLRTRYHVLTNSGGDAFADLPFNLSVE